MNKPSITNAYDILLFDADETLFDFKNASKLAFFNTLKELAVDLNDPSESYARYQDINHSLWTALELKEITADQLKERRFSLFFEHLGIDHLNGYSANLIFLNHLVQESFLYEDSTPLLTSLSHKRKAIITNGFKEVQRPRIIKLGIDHYFEHIVVSDEINLAKPERAYFDHVFDLFEQPNKASVLVIGDSLHSDIKGGQDYGVDTCWINWSNIDNKSDIKPTYEVNNLLALL